MTNSEDLIDFSFIEGHKENIQSLRGGRSAKKLAEIYSPCTHNKLSTPTPSVTRNVNDCIRAEYEAELNALSESDDPLEVFDRYVRWTLDAYPSTQATPQSQLHTLLERATKTFITSTQYKNDPRYLKLWIYYIQFFSDTPRETFLFLSRHGIGDGLALFYEEYAAWLEGAGRWSQAEEVYKLGIERDAQPVQRLLRKFGEFENRLANQPEATTEPASPALPLIRPALATKMDPFNVTSRSENPQGQRQLSVSKPAKPKLEVFSDADVKPPVLSSRSDGSKGWDSIGSLADRKKENSMQPTRWAGESLKTAGKKTLGPKMTVFRDLSLSQIKNISVVPSKSQVTVHPQTGKKECIFVSLASIYPTPEEPGTELSFEEVIAKHRGWLENTWDTDMNLVQGQDGHLHGIRRSGHSDTNTLDINQRMCFRDENGATMEPQGKLRAEKKNRLMEFNETQIIKANLDSPSGPKLRRRDMSEPTMTLHTRAATSDIYDIFNAPIKTDTPEDESADDNDYDTDGDYTTEVESTGTPQHVDASEHSDYNPEGASEWSDFPPRSHIPDVGTGKNAADQEAREAQTSGPDETEIIEPVEQSDHFAEYSSPLQAETDAETLTPRARTTFVPVPPEDYDPPTRPFRDPVETANNRLPFMTPITERTECSLDMSSEYHRHLKTPCKVDAGSPAMSETLDLGPLFSTLREIADEETPVSNRPVSLNAGNVAATSSTKSKALFPKQPIIKDRLCNPVDETVRKDILEKMQPSLASYPGFYDHGEGRFDRGHEIRRFAKAVSKANNKGAVDRAPLPPASISICFPETGSEYHVKRELGAGAFAPVYLVEKSPSVSGDGLQDDVLPLGKGSTTIHHNELRALKMESPPTAWEFHIMRTAHARLGPQHRASDSLSYAFEMHLYRDEAFLFLPYHPHGTLLDIVNYFRSEPSGVMDEQLAMFFAIELIRTVESLHSNGIMHGDLKADNCLLRLDSMAAGQPLATHWKADGSGGWSSRGLTLIDFGRSIDMEAFLPEVEFIADWKTSAQDCAEMREGRPWTWQIDYHGLAGIVHCLLFGKYIETTRCDQLGLVKSGRRYKIREGLKRYWQTDLWADCFDVLLNPASFVEAEENTKMPVQTSMKRIRERMESWLETNSERGTGLRSLMGKLEAYAKSRK